MDLLTAHQQKALDFEQHISLTANAGSGKTFVLSRRYIEIALSENGSLRKIAAITFTDKAASELYKKIAGQVGKRFSESQDEEEKKLLSRIRRQLVSANISTIHSFCIDILKQFPVEAGLDANFQPIDETTSDELIELSIEETIKNSLTGENDIEDIKYLIRFFGAKYIFALQLRSLVKNRKNIFTIRDEIYNRSEKEIAEYFYSSFLNTAESLLQINQNSFIESLERINETVLASNLDNERAIEIKRLLSDFQRESAVEKKLEKLISIKENAFTAKSEVRALGYLKKNLREGLSNDCLIVEKYISDLNGLFVDQNHQEIELELAKFGKTVLNIFNKVVEKYNLKKKENSYLDYEDILILTKNILNIQSVKDELSRKFKYIMVDEYQDTNEIQYKIFLPILDYLKTGNLFVVGDEKQSIYMFRDAELEVFNLTKKNISDRSGEKFLLSLPDSFRMAPGICLFVNKLFRNLFSNPNKLFNEVDHSDLVCAKQEETESLIEVIIGGSGKNDSDAVNENESEAELVAGRIISLVNGTGHTEKIKWKDIAILVRKRKSFSSLEKIFIEKNIPFNIIGGKGFYQRQSVYDIYNYFLFLLDAKNDTALVGILRSPFFNISDSFIYEISISAGETLWEKLVNKSRDEVKLKEVVSVLNKNIELSKTYRASQLLQKILGETPYLSVLSQKASGTQEVANISKLVRLTIGFQSKGYKTLYDYVNFLKESIEETENEAQAAIADESDSVKVMTLHQSKGMEYRAVFLYNAHEVTSPDTVKKRSIGVAKNYGLLTKVPLKNDYFGDYYSAPINSVYDIISSKKENAELKRLFYVGATRAKNYLFISATYSDNYRKNSFMNLLSESLNIDFTEPEFTIKDELLFLKEKENQFVNVSKVLEEKIRIRRNLVDIAEIKVEKSQETIEKKLLISEVNDSQKGEIISATKFAAFKQCPLKYHLTFDYGITNLVSGYKKHLFQNSDRNRNKYDFNYKEDKSYYEQNEEKNYLPADLRGSIIHKILQRNIPDASYEEIKKIIEEDSSLKDAEIAGSLLDDINKHLHNLYESDIYKKIMSHKKFFNEYEIFLNESNYFLHGIIDKLIINDKTAIIVDYKTDSIQNNEIFDRTSNYFPQLKFYSYIVSRLFKELTSFELRLIFINLPGEEIYEIVERKEVTGYGNEIATMVKQIRMREFHKNLSHCKDCNFAVKND